MTQSPDDDRNMALADAVADITEYIRSRLAVYAEATGNTADFHLIAVDDEDRFEVSSEVTDHDMMESAFYEQIERWVSSGHLVTPGIGEPLFTATFDPKKARPS